MTAVDTSDTPRAFSPLRRLVRAAAGKHRAHERRPKGTTVYLFTDSRCLGPGTLVDESAGGARVLCQNAHIGPLARYLLNPATGEAKTLEMAWHAGKKVGYCYKAVKQLRGYVFDPRLRHVQEFLTSHALTGG